jgi:nucleotide-binding universal stress UspA family protein
MFQTLLVPLDGSSLAERVLPLAEALAEVGGARLVLVRAVLARTVPGGDLTSAQVHAVDEADAYLRDIASRLGERGLGVETAVVYGEAAEGILDEIRLRRADVVVMATHGRSGLGRWVYGSVADAVLAHSPVPVLLVRAWSSGVEPVALQARPRLILTLDGSDFAAAAVPVAEKLVRALDGQLVLLHVVPAPERVLTADGRIVAYLEYGREAANLEQELDTRRTDAWNWLHQVASGVALRPGQVQLDVRVGDPAEAIAAAGREHTAALVVMATHGRTGLSRMLLGSVAASVVRRGSVPVLLVRPGALQIGGPALPLSHAASAAGAHCSLTLDEDELVLLRAALHTFDQTVNDREHLHTRVHRLLSRLPSSGEPVAAGRPNGADGSVAS